MDKLERAILGAIKSVPGRFKTISGGERVSRAPEYFLNVEIGQKLSRALHYKVWHEATLGQIRARHAGRSVRGKKHDSKKFDITAWHRRRPRAIVELKRANTVRGAHSTISEDCDKIEAALNAGMGLKVAYLLIHSEAPIRKKRKATWSA
ncbi:MAG: hypothetical protein ACT4O6_09855 [Reyranella sp.]